MVYIPTNLRINPSIDYVGFFNDFLLLMSFSLSFYFLFMYFFLSGSNNLSSTALLLELTSIRKAMDRQERNSSGYIEDRVGDCAMGMFGTRTMQ